MRAQAEPTVLATAAGQDPEPDLLPASRRRLLWGVWAVWCAVQAVRVLADGAQRVGADPTTAVVAPHAVDIDRARLAELRLLPGIGPERADAVLLERVRRGPFGSVDGLLRVPGLGEVTVHRLRAWVRAGPSHDEPGAGSR